MKKTSKSSKSNWQPLRELALKTPYTMGYLSLMARRGNLKVKKFGRAWHSTMEYIHEFEKKIAARKEQRKAELSRAYREKAGQISNQIYPGAAARPDEPFGRKAPTGRPLKVKVDEDTIFDEVQRELAEVLTEIRAKEKQLRKNYQVYREDYAETSDSAAGTGRPPVPSLGIGDLNREQQETEDISEKLIVDLGKLLNTANKIQEDEVENLAAEPVSQTTDENNYFIPVRNIGVVSAERKSGFKGSFSRDPSRVRGHESGAVYGRSRFGRGNNYKRDLDAALGNYPDKNFLSVPYSSFPHEKPNVNQNIHSLNHPPVSASSRSQNLLLFVAGVLVFIAAVLVLLVLFM